MGNFELEMIRYQRLAGLGRDLGGFVHNAAGPLNIILGYIQMMRMKYADEKNLGKMWDAGLELDRMLKELSSHIEASDNGYFQNIRVNELILKQLDLLRANNYFKHNVELAEELSADNPEIQGIFGDFSIIMDVIFNNAIEAVYNNDMKKIYVTTKVVQYDSSSVLEIIVRDTGNGIDEELTEKYFQEGFGNWQSSLGECHGMGLAVARYLIARFGGKLELRNSSGIGAESIITIPLRGRNEV
jgi:signal transduction histidine kinase